MLNQNKETELTGLYPRFSHIYIEKELKGNGEAERILSHFPNAVIITINHYKDLFNRRRQDSCLQHRSQKLILAQKHGRMLYKGAPVCQDFGNQYFYYASCVMNCIYDCEYCYLKGMYPSGNLVLFLNNQDVFSELRSMLAVHPVYLCISYDTDLLALEGLTGYVSEWAAFVLHNPGISVEIRTKTGSSSFWGKILERLDFGKDKEAAASALDRMIVAFTLSPEEVILRHEAGTGSLLERLRSIRAGIEMGFRVRLCFDPMIWSPDWKERYEGMIEQVFEELPEGMLHGIRDVGIGSFRISERYLKAMRRVLPHSAIVQYPYENDGGYYHYGRDLIDEMEGYLAKLVGKKLPAEKIFRWETIGDRGINR